MTSQKFRWHREIVCFLGSVRRLWRRALHHNRSVTSTSKSIAKCTNGSILNLITLEGQQPSNRQSEFTSFGSLFLPCLGDNVKKNLPKWHQVSGGSLGGFPRHQKKPSESLGSQSSQCDSLNFYDIYLYYLVLEFLRTFFGVFMSVVTS